jgi:DNA-binding SARP family transcriptional activator/DNA-binding beta-propeller fold protein YncE
VQFNLLGQLEVLDDGHREIPLAQGRRRALLTLLLLHRNEVVPAERLIEELWAGHPPPTATKGLQVQISRLRKDLAPAGASHCDALRTRGAGYVLEVAPDDVDVERFERAMAEAEAEMADGRPAGAAARLCEGLALWRGPPLADVAYESFAQAEIARLGELRMTAVERRIEADLALGHHREVVPELEALIREHPLRERFRAQLMVALYRSGRQADALEAYRAGRRRSIDELGLEAGPELRSLEAKILAGSPELAAPRSRPSVIDRAARRAPLLILVAGILLGGAAGVAALLIESGRKPAPRTASLAGVAPTSVVAMPARGRRPVFVVPLPGRPVDTATRGDQLLAVTVNSSALTVVDARTQTITRSVPLAMTPAAVAAAPDGAWIADGDRGRLARVDAGYRRITARARWRPTAPKATGGRSRPSSTGVAVAANAAWVTDGSTTLRRADAAGRVTELTAPDRLDGVAAAGDVVWAFSRSGASVIRIDARRSRITDAIPIVGRPGGERPAPIAIAATAESVWVLNGNTATVLHINARARGVIGSISLGAEHGPRDIAAAAGAAWVANLDGSVMRLPDRGGRVRSVAVGDSLIGVAAGERHVWLTHTAREQPLPHRAR